ncbi:neutral zinc metallopeptidase [Agilicoccus flavus]|uniref:neutral zinc metallopeptidase n=1 Tax=Agilicoccus flavus TaxID=2775968 RepID=UPI001CF68EF0|nr:neutral zinc metallopeptidase [Agilicoccus flavus]
MKRSSLKTLAATSTLLVALGAPLGATASAAAPAPSSTANAATSASDSATGATAPGPEARALLAKARAALGVQARARKARLDTRVGLDHDPSRARLLAAIDPDAYECGPTVVDRWVDRQLASFTAQDRVILSILSVYDIPTYDALFFGSDENPAYALRDGKALTTSFRTLQRFWDVRGDDIDLMAMHGSMLLDAPRVSRTYQMLYGLPRAAADELAALLVDYLRAPRFEGGDHPLFTLNALAFTTFGQEIGPGRTISDRIVMGDGILRAYRELGYGDVAPQMILAHEYGHHVQFELGMTTPSTGESPETTRRAELHADASSAYYLSHPRGEGTQWRRARRFLPVYGTIGDCQFASNGHHGTPNQRLRAGTWAYELQQAARPKDKVLPAATFRDLFDARLPTIVAPDRP